MGDSLISSNSRIGDFVKMNFFARVHHDVEVGNYCTIAPGATVLGRRSSRSSLCWSERATVLPGIKIEDWAIVGTGAVVTKDVEAGKTVKGVPAKD